MRTIIAGSRSIKDYELVKSHIIQSGFDITEVVSGYAVGVDTLGERWARENNIPVKIFIPDWTIGRSAGIRRNIEMGNYAEALIVIWDGESKGTKHMIDYANKKGLSVHLGRGPKWTPSEPSIIMSGL